MFYDNIQTKDGHPATGSPKIKVLIIIIIIAIIDNKQNIIPITAAIVNGTVVNARIPSIA